MAFFFLPQIINFFENRYKTKIPIFSSRYEIYYSRLVSTSSTSSIAPTIGPYRRSRASVRDPSRKRLRLRRKRSERQRADIHTPRYLTTAILFTRIDIAGHGHRAVTTTPATVTATAATRRDARSSFIVRKQFSARSASRSDRSTSAERRRVISATDVRNDL